MPTWTARALCSTDASISAPCSVNTSGRFDLVQHGEIRAEHHLSSPDHVDEPLICRLRDGLDFLDLPDLTALRAVAMVLSVE